MNSVSFLIALQVDSQDRLDNLNITIPYIQHYFPESEIILSEIDKESKITNNYQNCLHIFTESSEFFSKTKAYNIAAKKAKNDIICLYDVDIVLSKETLDKGIQIIKNNVTQILYPYNGYCYDVPKQYHQAISRDKNINSININECRLMSKISIGGITFFKKEVFEGGGGANENISIGYEDNEMFERFKKLGYSIGRINTPLFHLTHSRKETSFDYNPNKQLYLEEYLRILNMSKKDLQKEIKSWNHVK